MCLHVSMLELLDAVMNKEQENDDCCCGYEFPCVLVSEEVLQVHYLPLIKALPTILSIPMLAGVILVPDLFSCLR